MIKTKRDLWLITSLILLVFTSPVFTEKAATLPEIRRPDFLIHVDKDELFLVECEKIFIYSLKDYKLKYKFGKRGEGPQEFKVHPGEHVFINVQPGYIMVGSGGKVSFFSRSGQFKKEAAVQHAGGIIPFAGKYLAASRLVEDKKGYEVLNILDSDFKKLKEVCRSELHIKRDKVVFPNATFFFRTYKNNIFVNYIAGDFVLDCFDQNGAFNFSLKNEKFRKPRVSGEEEKRIHKRLRQVFGDWYINNRQRIKINDYWPAIGMFFIDNGIIYILTHIKKSIEKKQHSLFYLYDVKGKFLKKVFLPVLERHIFAPYPLTIKNGKLYQIFESLDSEEWELHISAIPTDD